MNKIHLTSDGSHTLFSEKFKEHYHSTHGAIQESMHIFIKSGLEAHPATDNLHLFEVGLGTGLNAYLTLLYAMHTKQVITYESIEKYPVGINIIKDLNFPQKLDEKEEELFFAIHQSHWNKWLDLDDYFAFKKHQKDFTLFSPEGNYDIIYFDAFSPEVQPELWKQDIFNKLYERSNKEAILTTYSSKGIIRRRLIDAGFNVEKIPGPPGKREILRAVKI